jgi:hypothetical protein
MAYCYFHGQGVPQDNAEAVRWCKKAADQGSAWAQSELAWLYYLGKGVPQDYTEAFRWYHKAADQSDATGQSGLGFMYEYGRGVPQDYTQAARWYGKAAEQRDATAQRHLGHSYRWGQGVPQNYAEAVRWYRKAAEQGDSAAEWYLGDAYRRGLGVPRDYVQSARWRLKLIGQAALHCTRRMGWTPFVVLLLTIGVLVVPERRWGRALWLSWALLSIADAVYAIHLVSVTVWGGWWRILDIALFATLSAMSALAAVVLAMREGKHRVDPSQPLTEGTTDNPA